MKIIVEVQIHPGRQNPAGIIDVQMRVTGGEIPTQIRGHPESPAAVRELPAVPSIHLLSLAPNNPS